MVVLQTVEENSIFQDRIHFILKAYKCISTLTVNVDQLRHTFLKIGVMNQTVCHLSIYHHIVQFSFVGSYTYIWILAVDLALRRAFFFFFFLGTLEVQTSSISKIKVRMKYRRNETQNKKLAFWTPNQPQSHTFSYSTTQEHTFTYAGKFKAKVYNTSVI